MGTLLLRKKLLVVFAIEEQLSQKSVTYITLLYDYFIYYLLQID
ncbi:MULTISPECIES: hypothetical protein [Lysinibacillus]|nr:MULTISPECIES: hypothetical protein [Lysinibacillus]WEA39552.1 hypothetical protein PWJ66_01060 [Lysinibacillus fusiformis]